MPRTQGAFPEMPDGRPIRRELISKLPETRFLFPLVVPVFVKGLAPHKTPTSPLLPQGGWKKVRGGTDDDARQDGRAW